MEREGLVVSVKEDSAFVRMGRLSACTGTCETCSGCEPDQVLLKLENSVGAEVGDFVSVEAERSTIYRFLLLLYIIPIVLFVLTIVFSNNIFLEMGLESYELLSFLSGIFVLFISFVLIRFVDKRYKSKSVLKISNIINM